MDHLEMLEVHGKAEDRNCQLCGIERKLTKHHLIPKAVHTKKKFVSSFGKKEMLKRHIMICKYCHRGLHDLIGEKKLAESFNTLESLLQDERVQKHIKWARKQK